MAAHPMACFAPEVPAELNYCSRAAAAHSSQAIILYQRPVISPLTAELHAGGLPDLECHWHGAEGNIASAHGPGDIVSTRVSRRHHL
jgi:hypothetical protein